MRLAWFSPWPPQTSGVAGRSAELVPALAAKGHGIDVFVDEAAVPLPSSSRSLPADAPPAATVRLQSAHDFVWRAERQQYDLVVYQVGNSRSHDFLWPYLFRWPGLAVLHDARIHHARGRALLMSHRAPAYRAEFTWSHPDVSRNAAELAVAGFDGTYYYLWPMTGAVVAASRFVAVHSRGGEAELQADFPGRPIKYVALGEGRRERLSPAARLAARSALGLSPASMAFGVFGALTPEKRIAQILRAFATTVSRHPEARLILAGAAGVSSPWRALISRLGISGAVSMHEALDDDGFDQAIAAVDVSLNLRWPTALETSGPWVRALAAGRPTVVTDLAHQSHLPALDPRTWQSTRSGSIADDRDAPITVAIDLLDEDHSLGLAMRRLAADVALRDRLGEAARTYWEREHAVERMVEDYAALLETAASAPLPTTPLPDTIVSRPDTHMRALLSPFGNLSCELF